MAPHKVPLTGARRPVGEAAIEQVGIPVRNGLQPGPWTFVEDNIRNSAIECACCRVRAPNCLAEGRPANASSKAKCA
jgi:hypothetical protein